jgi:hypothetical protein
MVPEKLELLSSREGSSGGSLLRLQASWVVVRATMSVARKERCRVL